MYAESKEKLCKLGFIPKDDYQNCIILLMLLLEHLPGKNRKNIWSKIILNS